MRSIIYPGSFDPLTNGHLDLIQRACEIFDQVIVAVAQNPHKPGFLPVPKRLELLKACTADLPKVSIDSFEGLLVDYAKSKGVKTVLRGLRAVSDFEYEFMMANMNRQLSKDVETLFMMTGETHFYVSSKLVREVSALGGDIRALVPDPVWQLLAKS